MRGGGGREMEDGMDGECMLNVCLWFQHCQCYQEEKQNNCLFPYIRIIQTIKVIFIGEYLICLCLRINVYFVFIIYFYMYISIQIKVVLK